MFDKMISKKIILTKECIAKTYKQGDENPEIKIGMTVKEHSLIVTAVAETLYKRLPQDLQKYIPGNYKTIVALHDLGKISVEFQFKTLPEELLKEYHGISDKINITKTHHPIISSKAIRSYFKEIGYKNRKNIDKISRVIGQHHGSVTSHLIVI